jgi:toxin ParE1/3/4
VSGKLVVPRARASQDIDDALTYYLTEAGEAVALRFIDAVEAAFRHLSAHPSSGSLRFAYELDLPGLRAWPLHRFPWLVFYSETDQQVDVWRVLHGRRDIPAWLGETLSND